MKRHVAVSIAFAAVLSLAPRCGFAQGAPGQDPNFPGPTPTGGKHEAMKMVPARVTLTATLNAKKSQIGETFGTKLVSAVRFDSGVDLRAGTILTGTVETGELLQGGMSRLALRYNGAKLKDGTISADQGDHRWGVRTGEFGLGWDGE